MNTVQICECGLIQSYILFKALNLPHIGLYQQVVRDRIRNLATGDWNTSRYSLKLNVDRSDMSQSRHVSVIECYVNENRHPHDDTKGEYENAAAESRSFHLLYFLIAPVFDFFDAIVHVTQSGHREHHSSERFESSAHKATKNTHNHSDRVDSKSI